ncbi:mCG1042091 [Mus musculus]|nr:mCG1042091 [Mus musculus]
MLRIDKSLAQTSYKLGTKGSFLLDAWPDSRRGGEKWGILPCEAKHDCEGSPWNTSACWELPTGRSQNWGGGSFLEGGYAV